MFKLLSISCETFMYPTNHTQWRYFYQALCVHIYVHVYTCIHIYVCVCVVLRHFICKFSLRQTPLITQFPGEIGSIQKSPSFPKNSTIYMFWCITYSGKNYNKRISLFSRLKMKGIDRLIWGRSQILHKGNYLLISL